MQLEFHKKGEDVINYGEQGELFYMILEGNVEVWELDWQKK